MDSKHFDCLERRWRNDDSIENEARYLAQSLRSGEISIELLRVAAYCGHEAAVLVSDVSAYSGDERDYQRWLRALRKISHRAVVLATVICAEETALSQANWVAADQRYELCLEAARTWIEQPTEQNRRIAEQASRIELELGELSLAVGVARTAVARINQQNRGYKTLLQQVQGLRLACAARRI